MKEDYVVLDEENNNKTDDTKKFFSNFFCKVFLNLLIGIFVPYWAFVYPINIFFIYVIGFSEKISNILTTIVFVTLFLLFNVHSTLKEFIKDFKDDTSKKNIVVRNKIIEDGENYKKQIILDADNYKKNIMKEVNSLHAQKENTKKEINNLLNTIQSNQNTLLTLKSNIQSTLNDIDAIKSNTKQHLTKLYEPNTIGYPWLAELYSDIAYIEENKIAEYLKMKKIPAIKASENISKISKEKRILQKQLKIAQNQLNYYETVFPWLEDFKEADPIEAYETLNNLDNADEYSRIKNYLSPEEYQKLSSSEKYQLALDRWRNKPNKTAWQIGIDYERYIGYVYEIKGYKVIYNGALKGLEDMGRDIIAKKDSETLVVQCKYWNKEKTIHEKHIFQLYGTVILEKMKSNTEVKGVFVTSTTLSETALAVAKELSIDIQQNVPFNKEYPCIKCNINNSTGEKIYHLPFDQQYDRVQIEPTKGEFYAKTTKEAEKKVLDTHLNTTLRIDSLFYL